MRVYFYRLDTGIFTGRSFSGSPRAVEANTPDGCGAIGGVDDWMSQRVDIETGALIDYQPPQPDADYAWNAQTKRWVKRPEVAKWEFDRERALVELRDIDLRRSRALSDHILNPTARASDGKTPQDRLEELEAESETLRAIVNAPKP